MIPAYATVNGQLVFLLVVEVQTCHLRRVQTLATTTETTATTATGEAHVVGVVGIGHEEHLEVVLHHATEDTASITVFGTGCQVGINHDTLVHTGLNTKIEDGFLFTVLNTGNTSHIALLVVCLDVIDDVCGQILHGCLGIACHELLTVNKDFLHLLTINLNRTIVAHLGTGETTHQLFNNRAFGRTIGSGIINEGVLLDSDL